MSSPYVYNPQPSYPTYQYSNYLDPQYSAPQNSPFIPNLTFPPSSPYGSPYSSPYARAGSLPGSPNFGPTALPAAASNPYATNIYAFPQSAGGNGLVVDTPTDWSFPRQRRPSWHGGAGSPLYREEYLQPNTIDYFRERRHSFGNTGSFGNFAPATYQPPAWNTHVNSAGLVSPWGSYTQPLPSGGPPFTIHPWLNGEQLHLRNDFRCDLSAPDFTPQKLGPSGAFIPLSREELSQPATQPAISRVRIVCEWIPQWPIDLQYNPYGNPVGPVGVGVPESRPPILFADVLVAIHRMLHQRISHIDWSKLSKSEEHAVTKAYTQRCASFGSMEAAERSQGVKKVDFLLGKVWFRGLVPTAQQDTMRLILA